MMSLLPRFLCDLMNEYRVDPAHICIIDDNARSASVSVCRRIDETDCCANKVCHAIPGSGNATMSGTIPTHPSWWVDRTLHLSILLSWFWQKIEWLSPRSDSSLCAPPRRKREKRCKEKICQIVGKDSVPSPPRRLSKHYNDRPKSSPIYQINLKERYRKHAYTIQIRLSPVQREHRCKMVCT